MQKKLRLLVPIMGYLAVSLFCLFAGGFIGALGRYPESLHRETAQLNFMLVLPSVSASWSAMLLSSNATNVVFFFLFMCLFLVAKQILVESDMEDYSDEVNLTEMVNTSRSIIYVLLGCYVFYLLSRFMFESQPSLSNRFIRDALLCASILIPIISWLRTTNRMLRDPKLDLREHALKFANRVYYPSLFSCIISFLYGWILTQESFGHAYLIVFFASIFLTATYLYSIHAGNTQLGPSVSFSNKAMLIFLFLSPFAAKLLDTRIINAVIFSILFAFALGVAEVSQRIYTHSARRRYQPAIEGASFYEAGANWSTVLLIPSVPLMALIEPRIPVWFLAMYSIAFLLFWIFSANMNTKLYSWFSIAFGFLLPVWVCAGAISGIAYPTLISLVAVESIASGVGYISLLLFIVAAAVAADAKAFHDIIKGRASFEYKRNALLLFVFVSIVFIVLSNLLSSFVHLFASDPELSRRKMWELQIFITILTLAALLFYFFKNKNDPRDGVSDGTQGESLAPDRRAGYTIANSIIVTTQMGRPVISGIAGGAVFLLVAQEIGSWRIEFLSALVSMTVVTMFGFVINDIVDLPKDVAGQRSDKLLVSQIVSEKGAKIAACSFILFGIISGFFAGGASTAYLVGAIAIALTCYSWFARTLPWAKGVYTAILCMSPLPMAESIVGYSFIPIHIYGFGILFFVGRELLIDVVDMPADIKSGLATLAVRLGARTSLYVAWVTMSVAFLLLLPIVGTFGVLCIVASVLFVIYVAITSRTRLFIAAHLTRINVALGVLAVANALAQ